jgi:hypothetical protein
VASPLDTTQDTIEQTVEVDGISIPADMAAKAVRRCIAGIQAIDQVINKQGFASEKDLRAIRAGLTGEDAPE